MLKHCGHDLTRENVMKQAASLQHLELPMLVPGIAINTRPNNFAPIRQAQTTGPQSHDRRMPVRR
jgi:branched-chain amino acid transport system substrate-binding protein